LVATITDKNKTHTHTPVRQTTYKVKFLERQQTNTLRHMEALTRACYQVTFDLHVIRLLHHLTASWLLVYLQRDKKTNHTLQWQKT